MFQSRNRGSFDFKHIVIKIKLSNDCPFQSRNRGSFDFKLSYSLDQGLSKMFQSRNRGSFDFKSVSELSEAEGISSFNLVIEVLLISSRQAFGGGIAWQILFQSRNRGSFDFKSA